MAITTQMRESVMELYTAYFNRAADRNGVDYWLNEMDTKGWSVDTVAQSFADSPEYANTYSGMTNAQIVSQVYNNVLNRDADAGGAAYWEGELNSGAIQVNQLIQAVVNAAKNDVDNLGDDDVLANKNAVSQYCYDSDINETDISLDTVTAEYGSINYLISHVDEILSYGELFDDEEWYDDEEGWGEVETWSDELGHWIVVDEQIENAYWDGFDFTQEWLSGKTLIHIFGGENFVRTETFVFNYNNTGNGFTYSVDSEGALILSSDLGTMEFRAVDAFDTLNAIEVDSNIYVLDGFFALDQETANYLVENFYDLL